MACEAERWTEATTLALESFGEEIFSYLIASTRSEADASEIYSMFCENLWKGLRRFRWESSFRTWAYVLARHAWSHFARDPNRRRGRRVPLSEPEVERIAADVRSRTITLLRTEMKDRLTELRDQLAADDRSLLILRVDRKLSWSDIAAIVGEDEDDAAARTRRAATLRKRFERIKADLRAKLRA